MVLSLALGFTAVAAAADSPDSWITTKTKIALLTADDVSGMSINVDTVSGKVTLHGKVATEAEKTRAEQIARKVDGVKQVSNLLQVIPAEQRDAVKASDSEIKERVDKTLDADQALKDVNVASVNAGVVLLEGKVDNLSLALRAIEKAKDVPGVHRVASEIEAPDDHARSVADKAAAKTERAVDKGAAKTEHAADKVAHKTERAVDKGAAKTEHAADKTAAKAEGVEKDRPDSWVTIKTKLALLTSDDVSGTHIKVDTRNGRVTLQGKVPTEAEKSKAEHVTRRIDGVKDVKNLIQVVPAAKREEVKASDKEIEDRVDKALSADGSLKGISIASVNNGVVLLKGEAKSLGQTLRAVETAGKVSGVRRVSSEIKVEKVEKE